MNYPVWDVPVMGSGLVIAVIAIIHILISHIAIGGGAFLFAAEWWASRQSAEDGEKIRRWLHKFATYFLVYTTVAGALTGVGIWFSIQLASPEATSLLIHQFVFVWALEWVVFFLELSLLYFYYYGWGRNSRKAQLHLAGAYFYVAWLSLFAINGILSFMLTPGGWTIQNTDLGAGFFNPTFWPSLFIRTLVMIMVGGLFGLLSATTIKGDAALKKRVVAFCAKLVLPAALILPALFHWYATAVPASTSELVALGATGISGGQMEAITRFLIVGLISTGLVFLGVGVMAFFPRSVNKLAAISLLIVAQFGIAGGEFFREMARKPYVVYNTLYSNSTWKHKLDNKEYAKGSYSDHAVWMPDGVKSDGLKHGEWIFRLQCANCHTRDGYRSLKKRTADWTPVFGYKWFAGMHETKVMPPFVGNAADKAALVAYLKSLNGVKLSPGEVLKAVVLEASKNAKKNK